MDNNSFKNITERLVKIGRELYQRGLSRGNSGNISARIPGINAFLIKRSGAKLGTLQPQDFVIVDLQGNKRKGRGRVSLETPLHAIIYQTRRDANAVIHTHSPTATAFGIAKKEILPLQIEVFMRLPDGVPIVPYKAPGSKSLAEAVQKGITKHDALILENHGVIAVGQSIEDASDLIEMVEESANIQFLVSILDREGAINLRDLKNKFTTKPNGESKFNGSENT